MLISLERIPESSEEVTDGKHYLKRVKDMMLSELYPFFIQRIIKEVGFGPGRALEIGPGPLPLGFFLSKQTQWDIEGGEISPDIVEIGRKAMKDEDKKMRYRLEVANAEDLPYKNGTFNLVFSSGSLHHWVNPVKVFQEIFRVLAPGGTAIIFDLSREVYSDKAGFKKIMDRVRDEYKQGLLESLKAAYVPEEIYGLIEKSGYLDNWQRICFEQYHSGVSRLNQCTILQKPLRRQALK